MTAITADPQTVETPIETHKPMKLSEALRLGSIATTQAHGEWSIEESDGTPKMCAISTAWYALTGHEGNDAFNSALDLLLSRHMVKHPVSGDVATVRTTIINLNDEHKWSRPRIAGFLEDLGL